MSRQVFSSLTEIFPAECGGNPRDGQAGAGEDPKALHVISLPFLSGTYV